MSRLKTGALWSKQLTYRRRAEFFALPAETVREPGPSRYVAGFAPIARSLLDHSYLSATIFRPGGLVVS